MTRRTSYAFDRLITPYVTQTETEENPFGQLAEGEEVPLTPIWASRQYVAVQNDVVVNDRVVAAVNQSVWIIHGHSLSKMDYGNRFEDESGNFRTVIGQQEIERGRYYEILAEDIQGVTHG